jgi:hypothetical protein
LVPVRQPEPITLPVIESDMNLAAESKRNPKAHRIPIKLNQIVLCGALSAMLRVEILVLISFAPFAVK